VTEAGRRHQFYGRRKGHALRRHHLELIETLLPKVRFHPEALDVTAAAAICLEVGFGGGEHLAHVAAGHPDTLFIGAEPFINGVAKLLARIEAAGLSNIRIHDGDVRYLFEALPEAVFDRIYLLYPDPWPKTRHHRRRLINPDNLAQIHRLLKPGGQFLFASDSAEYVDWTLEQVAAHGGFTGPEGDCKVPFAGWIETRYEAKARAAGRLPSYLLYRKRSG
jgi:tRNA (guanine-N7-)-methyltransferase